MTGKDGGATPPKPSQSSPVTTSRGSSTSFPNTDVYVKARRVSSIHSCLDRIPAAAFRRAVQILSCFSDEEFEIVVKGRRRRFLEHGAHLFTPLFRIS